MTTLRQAAQQALESLRGYRREISCEQPCDAERFVMAALEQPEQPCNCRWVGDVQTQQCTLHEAHVDAIHEWAERAKAAEAKLAALANRRSRR
jgi:DNA-binding protein Fis